MALTPEQQKKLYVAGVLAAVVALAFWWRRTHRIRLTVTALDLMPNDSTGMLYTLGYTTTSKSDPAKWKNAPIALHTKSLGALTLKVVGPLDAKTLQVTPTTAISLAPYTAAKGDSAVVSL